MKADKEATEVKTQSLFDFNADAEKKEQCLELVKCKGGKKCIYVCCSENCESHAVLCADIYCDCQKNHNQGRPCPAQQLPVILKILQSKKESFPGLLKLINTKYDELIDWISEQREKVYLRTKSAGLTEAQMTFLNTVYAKKSEELTGKRLHQVVKDLHSEKKQMEQIEALLINQIEDQLKICTEKIQKSVTALNQFINYACKHNFSIKGLYSKVAVTESQKETLTQFLNNEKRKVLKYELLYRASENDFDSSIFWQKCNHKADTVTLIHTDFDKVVGGYTPLSWMREKGDGNWEQDPSLRSFLFSVTEKTKFALKEQNKQHAIYHNTECGPIFGGGCDISVHNHANSNNSSYAYIGYSYDNSIVQYNTKEAWRFFQGSTENYFFKIREWEVWQIIFE